jgi:8-oxo-dGTP pyrophosphatase MutT (NUDIX family)
VEVSLAASGIVFDDGGRVLLVFTDEQLWMAPGGHLETGESPEEAVVRELREEISVLAVPETLVGIYTLRYQPGSHYRFAFRCRIHGEPRIGDEDEIKELGWFAPHALPEPLARSAPVIIADAVAGRTGVVRTVD